MDSVLYCRPSCAQNPNPTFAKPQAYLKKPPVLIQEALKLSAERSILDADQAVYARACGDRQKNYYPDRRAAIRAITDCLLQHVNLVTLDVQISYRKIADLCGLSTISRAELAKVAEAKEKGRCYRPAVSITRVTRGIKDIIELGGVYAPREWQTWDDAYFGHWIDKQFSLTPVFFELLGVTPERLQKHRAARLAYLQKQAKAKNWDLAICGLDSISQYTSFRRNEYRVSIYEQRKQIRAAERAERHIKDKGQQEQRQYVIRYLIQALGMDEIKHMGPRGLNGLINIELGKLRAHVQSCGEDPPTQH